MLGKGTRSLHKEQGQAQGTPGQRGGASSGVPVQRTRHCRGLGHLRGARGAHGGRELRHCPPPAAFAEARCWPCARQTAGTGPGDATVIPPAPAGRERRRPQGPRSLTKRPAARQLLLSAVTAAIFPRAGRPRTHPRHSQPAAAAPPQPTSSGRGRGSGGASALGARARPREAPGQRPCAGTPGPSRGGQGTVRLPWAAPKGYCQEPCCSRYTCHKVPSAPGRPTPPCLWFYAKGDCSQAGIHLSSQVTSDRAYLKMRQGRFTSNIRKNLFTERIIRRWNGLTREAVETPTLEMFKERTGRGT